MRSFQVSFLDIHVHKQGVSLTFTHTHNNLDHLITEIYRILNKYKHKDYEINNNGAVINKKKEK